MHATHLAAIQTCVRMHALTKIVRTGTPDMHFYNDQWASVASGKVIEEWQSQLATYNVRMCPTTYESESESAFARTCSSSS